MRREQIVAAISAMEDEYAEAERQLDIEKKRQSDREILIPLATRLGTADLLILAFEAMLVVTPERSERPQHRGHRGGRSRNNGGGRDRGNG